MQGMGSPNLKLHAATDINIKLTGAFLTEIIEFNLFSLHDSQSRPITPENDGVHLFNKQMAFPRSETGSCLLDTRITPTPILKTAFTAVLAKFGSELPPRMTVARPLCPPRVERVAPLSACFPPTA